MVVLEVYLFSVVCAIIVSFYAGRLATPIIIFLLSRFASHTKTSLDDYILKEVRSPLESSMFFIILFAIIHTFPFFSTTIELFDSFITAIIVIVLTFLVFKVIKAIFHWYYEEGHKTSRIKIDVNLLPLFQKISQILILGFGLTISLGELGFDITALLAITSVITLIIGLASQETLANIFAGIALQLDRSVNYGDIFRIPTGEIVRLRKIGLRTTKLYDLSGNPFFVSNSEFAKLRLQRISVSSTVSIPVYFEAPISIPLEYFIENVRKRLKEAHPEDVDLGGITASISRIRNPGWFDGSVKIPFTNLRSYEKSKAVIQTTQKALIETINSSGK